MVEGRGQAEGAKHRLAAATDRILKGPEGGSCGEETRKLVDFWPVPVRARVPSAAEAPNESWEEENHS